MFDQPTSTWHLTELIELIRSEELTAVITRLTSGNWRVGWLLEEGGVTLGSQYKSSIDINKYQFLSSLGTPPDKIEYSGIDAFAFLRITNKQDIPIVLKNLQVQNHTISRGQSVFAVGSPWGLLTPRMSLNSITRGVISNVVQESNTIPLAIIDARISPGVEGGAIFSSNGALLGMCLAPIR
jgi:hypothetical protein